ncbi:MAG: hypothetical protein ACXU9G_02345 [Syntrophales bacterium]
MLSNSSLQAVEIENGRTDAVSGERSLTPEKEVRPYGIHIVDVFYITYWEITDAAPYV